MRNAIEAMFGSSLPSPGTQVQKIVQKIEAQNPLTDWSLGKRIGDVTVTAEIYICAIKLYFAHFSQNMRFQQFLSQMRFLPWILSGMVKSECL